MEEVQLQQRGSTTDPKHGEVVVALFHGIIDRVYKPRVVSAALRNVVGTGAGGSGHSIAHDLGDELRGFFPAVVERLVRIRVGLHDEVDVGLEGSKLGAVMAIPVV